MTGRVWRTDLAGAPAWVDPKRLSRQVWDAESAKSIPGLGRGLGIYGMVAQCALLHQRTAPGTSGNSREELGLSLFLQRPDPDMALPTFIGAHVEDWLLNGNALHLVTVRRQSDNYPAAVRYFPSHRWGIQEVDGQPVYHLDGQEVDREDVVHVRRGVDPAFTWRGIGVVEQYLATWNQSGLERAAQVENLASRGMPSVVITQPENSEYDPVNADAVAAKWEERFGGSQTGRPAVLPGGSVVTPLNWKPSDQELVLARGMTVRDMANALNLDSWWLGDPGGSHNYTSPAPMFLTLLRTSLATMLSTFEDVWSWEWLPYGRGVRFDTLELLRDDLRTMVQTFAGSSSKALFPDPNEPRRYMGFPELPESAWPAPPPQLVAPVEDPPVEEPPAEEDPPAAPADEEGAA